METLRGCGGGAGGGRGKLRQAILQTALLSCLANGPAHGYSLIESVSLFVQGQTCVDPGSIYRILRGLEADGCVTSEWESPSSGPGRRVYEITTAGRDLLRHWCVFLERRAAALVSITQRGRLALGEAGDPENTPTGCGFCEEAFFD